MNTPVPVVRYMVMCEKVKRDPGKAHPISLIGVIGQLHRSSKGEFPRLLPEFYVFLQLTECRGPGRARIEIRHAESDELVIRTITADLDFATDPLAVQGLSIRIHDCSLPRAGLYDVQFWYNDAMIAQHPLQVH
jgi:hypothetical protein